ncbi:MAG: AraC family transcriptional regulator [Verrucomicrobia bacterium]|nr:AraC family transcriptional regulator [Verrucomicrobiota bacterium]
MTSPLCCAALSGMPAARPSPTPPAFVSQQVTSARRFYLNLKPRATRDLTVVCGGWEECSADYRIDRATFPFLSVEFVASGRGEVSLNGETQPLEPGTVFTYGPGVAQRITTSPEQRLGKYFVDFTGDRGRRLLREAGLKPGTVVTLGASTEVRHAFDTLVRLASVHDRQTAHACALQLELLLLVIARATQPGTPSERRALATFERIRQHLDAHFLALRTLEDAAAACHVDVSYLCRLFRRFHGEKPFRYLQRLQMQWAAERLHTSGRLIREVADELQIDQFQFSRTFKRIHGVSPSAFLSTRG